MKLITTKRLADIFISNLNENGFKATRTSNNQVQVIIEKDNKSYNRYFTNEEFVVYGNKVAYHLAENE